MSCGFVARENDFSRQLNCSSIAFISWKEINGFRKNIILALEGVYTIDTINKCNECVVRPLLFEK